VLSGGSSAALHPRNGPRNAARCRFAGGFLLPFLALPVFIAPLNNPAPVAGGPRAHAPAPAYLARVFDSAQTTRKKSASAKTNRIV
jgi:hypothetical protein